jgi:hypothetical protein
MHAPYGYLHGLGIAAGFMLLVCLAAADAQVPVAPDARASEAAKPAAMAQMLSLRDAFVKAAAGSGMACPIPPPAITLTDIPSYGNYDPDTNSLQTPIWELLKPEERALFYRLARQPSGGDPDESAARREFEIGARRWVFIHEMGHWWQACRKVNDGRKPYAFEYEADRIAAAYWRETDPEVARHMQPIFHGLMEHAPNPVPSGKDTAAYFNDNYEKLGPTPAYIWFQSQMCDRAFAEKPPPSFLQTLRETGHP